MKKGISYCAFLFLFLVINQQWSDGANTVVPDFKDIYINVTVNASLSTPIEQLVSMLDVEALFQNQDFKNAMDTIGVKNLQIPLLFSTIQLKNGSRTAFNMTKMLVKIAEANPTKDTYMIKIVEDSFQLDDRGSNIDYKVISSNQQAMKLFLAGVGVPYQAVASLINVEKVMSSVDVKRVALTLLSSNESINDVLLNNLDYNILVHQIRIESLIKNPMIQNILKDYGINQDLLDIIHNLDSTKVIQAFDFNKIVDSVFKLRNGGNTEADIMVYIKVLISSLNTKHLANLGNLNQFINILLKQNPIIAYLNNIGISPDLIKTIFDSININELLKDVDLGKLLKYNGTSLTGFYKYLLDKVNFTRVSPDFNIEKLLQIPQVLALLNQTKVDPELVKIVIESVNVNEFLKSFDVPGLIRDLRTNKDQDYIKVLLNNTDINGVLKSIDIDKLFSHEKVADFVRTNFQVDPLLAKLLLKNFNVGDFLKQVDTKAWSKILVSSVNGTAQVILEKILNLVTIDALLQNVDFQNFLNNPTVQQFMKQYGIDPIILEVVSSLGLDDLIKSVKFDQIIRDAIKSGNFDVKDVLQKIMAQVDMTKILKNLDWKKLIEGATTGKFTSLPVSPECAIELGKFAMASNSSSSLLKNPLFKSELL